jgi:hypothetical protein
MQSYCFFLFMDTERQSTEKLEKREKTIPHLTLKSNAWNYTWIM